MSTETVAEMREQAIEEGNTVQLVVFSLCGEEYGVGILDVREIVRTGKITVIPNSPDLIRGIINLRSNIVSVIDLERRFMMQREGEAIGKHIVIAEMGDNTFGLLVDEVTDVLRLPESVIKEAPAIITEKMGIDYVKGVGALKDKLIILLDLKKVLSEKELVELSKMSTQGNRTIELKKEDESTEQEIPAEKPPKKK